MEQRKPGSAGRAASYELLHLVPHRPHRLPLPAIRICSHVMARSQPLQNSILDQLHYFRSRQMPMPAAMPKAWLTDPVVDQGNPGPHVQHAYSALLFGFELWSLKGDSPNRVHLCSKDPTTDDGDHTPTRDDLPEFSQVLSPRLANGAMLPLPRALAQLGWSIRPTSRTQSAGWSPSTQHLWADATPPNGLPFRPFWRLLRFSSPTSGVHSVRRTKGEKGHSAMKTQFLAGEGQDKRAARLRVPPVPPTVTKVGFRCQVLILVIIPSEQVYYG